MPSLSSVTIDAGVLALPLVNCAKDDAFKYVDMLLDWSKLLDEPWIAIYMSERASETQFFDDLYPLRDQLRELFIAHGVVEYDVNTVARIIDRLLETTPSFETHYRVKDVLLTDLETDPDVIELTTHNGLQSDLGRCITLTAVLRKHCSQSLGGHSLILREAPNQLIQVRAWIYDIEHSRSDIPVLRSPREFFEGDVLVCDDFHGLIDCLDESTILIGAFDDLGIKLAIRMALFKKAIAQGDCPDWSDAIVPAIGSRFRELCQQVCADQGDSVPPKILRSIVETIEGLNRSAVHALRTGSGGNNPQKCVAAIKRSVEISIESSIFTTGTVPTEQSSWPPWFITTIFLFRHDEGFLMRISTLRCVWVRGGRALEKLPGTKLRQQFPLTLKLAGSAITLGVRHGLIVLDAQQYYSG